MAKVAVITGSNGLIGQATCRRLAQSGHIAVGIDVGAEGAGSWPHYQCDLRDLAQMETVLTSIEDDHGLIRVLFNNAGVFHPGKDWLDVPPEQFDDTLSVNLRVPFLCFAVGGQAANCGRSNWSHCQHCLIGRAARQHCDGIRSV
jgi:3-oxoacyl-[acyl-carrier protein] reductase